MDKYQLVLENVLEKDGIVSSSKSAKIVNLETGETKYIVPDIMEIFMDYVQGLENELDKYKKMGNPEDIQNVINNYYLNKPAFDEYVSMFGDIETARKLYSEEADYNIEEKPKETKEDKEKPAKKGLI